MKETTPRASNTSSTLTTNSRIIKTIISAIQEKKGEEIISLNLKKIPEAVADFFIICEAGNPTLVKAIADNVEKRVKENCGENPYCFSGKQGDQWVLLDYVDVIVHCMMPQARAFYNLEDMWQDATSKQHVDE
ncbi:MAG: ribosome silencing factor [Chitinophagaceae bacterium]